LSSTSASSPSWAVEKGDVIGARRAAAERDKDGQGSDGEPRHGSDERRREPGAAQEPHQRRSYRAKGIVGRGSVRAEHRGLPGLDFTRGAAFLDEAPALDRALPALGGRAGTLGLWGAMWLAASGGSDPPRPRSRRRRSCRSATDRAVRTLPHQEEPKVR